MPNTNHNTEPCPVAVNRLLDIRELKGALGRRLAEADELLALVRSALDRPTAKVEAALYHLELAQAELLALKRSADAVPLR